MRKQVILFFLGCVATYSNLVFSSISPVAAVRIGSNWTDWGSSQHVSVVDGFLADRYIADKDIEAKFGTGALIGAEWATAWSPWRVQAGISYDYVNQSHLKGRIWEFGAPYLNDLSYKYKIQHERLDGELKVLRKMGAWYPYVTGALGIAWNKSRSYTENSDSVTEVPRDPFKNTMHNSFTWSVGLGIERSLGNSLRLGLGYLYTDAGKAKLDAINTDESLTVDNLSINQALLQVTYVMCGLCTRRD